MPRTAWGRVWLTLAVSLVVHLTLIWVPWLDVPPPVEPELPPLTAKLVALPKQPVAMPPAKPTPRSAPPIPMPAAPVESVAEDVDATSSVEVASNVEAASSVAAASEVLATSNVAAVSTVVAPSVPVDVPPGFEHPTLPKHAQLRFLIFKGKDFQVGEAKHRLEIDGDHYTLKVSMSTTGIVSLFKVYDSEQISTGTLDAQGLRPDSFTENKRTGKGKESFGVKFNWGTQQLEFSSGSTVTLPAHTQDLMSALYQVSQLNLSQGKIVVPVTNGRRLERYEFEIGAEQPLPSRLGVLRALPLRKVRAEGGEGLEIWLALEYRLLPIKFTQTDRAGQIAAEMVIDDIRVAD